MIFGNLKALHEYPFLEKQILECFAYAQAHDLKSLEKGSHPIDGDRLFVNIVEYTTTTPENRFWEAHRAYLDVHLMLDGTEQIDLNFIQNMVQKDTVPGDDFLPMDGEKWLCHPACRRLPDLLPSDGHRTAVAIDTPQPIKKAIFKVRI